MSNKFTEGQVSCLREIERARIRSGDKGLRGELQAFIDFLKQQEAMRQPANPQTSVSAVRPLVDRDPLKFAQALAQSSPLLTKSD